MNLGVNVAYWGLGLTADEHLRVVQAADRLGYDSVRAAEAYGSDAATVLAWLAAEIERIKLGSAIIQIPARSPAMTAMTAATPMAFTLDERIDQLQQLAEIAL
jgi:alkanesulfonate monooxygenase SsuD/methylene tetrahydromethanopterin reductase-like flavin-dependent oxidoreductase (luciferase family)